jgi:hypothetical protein
MSQIVLAAIAYTDARCARHAGYVNQQYAAVTIWWCRIDPNIFGR